MYPVEDYPSWKSLFTIVPQSKNTDKYTTVTQIEIGFLIYPGVIQLDVMGAYQVLSFPPNIQIHLIGKDQSPIVSDEGLTIVPTVTPAVSGVPA